MWTICYFDIKFIFMGIKYDCVLVIYIYIGALFQLTCELTLAKFHLIAIGATPAN
jgi:hypothetical protein